MINKAILIGYTTAKPEVRYSKGGAAIANFTLATTEKYTKDDQKQEHTEWHRIVAFGRLGEICGEYIDKGTRLYIEGKIQTREWRDKEGNKRYSTEIVAQEMKMLTRREGALPTPTATTKHYEHPEENAVDSGTPF